MDALPLKGPESSTSTSSKLGDAGYCFRIMAQVERSHVCGDGSISFMLLTAWRPQSNQCCWLFVFQRGTQAENLYPAKRIELRQLNLVRGRWGGVKSTVTLTLSTLKHYMVCKKRGSGLLLFAWPRPGGKQPKAVALL